MGRENQAGLYHIAEGDLGCLPRAGEMKSADGHTAVTYRGDPGSLCFPVYHPGLGVGVLNHLRFNVTQRNCRGSRGRGQHIPFGKGLGLSSLKDTGGPGRKGLPGPGALGGGLQGSEGSGPSPIGQHQRGTRLRGAQRRNGGGKSPTTRHPGSIHSPNTPKDRIC